MEKFILDQIKELVPKNNELIKKFQEDKKMKKRLEELELLLPAGDLIKLKYAFKFGANAVYAGLPYYSLRIKENKFKYNSLLKAIDYTKKLGKKIYVTVNIYPRGNFNESHFLSVIDEVYSKGADALIMSDPGLIDLVRENFDIPIHLSVQANATNYLAVKFWKKMGLTRVILPRELILEEIKTIHEKVPDIELEFFVHGSICMAYSGRCLISAYMSKRLANLGQCNNACRWNYRVFLEEKERPGQLYYIEEDEFGTYFFNSRDYNLIMRIPELVDAGIISFKVEGRNKTEYYVAVVAKVYRKIIDKIKRGEEITEKEWIEALKELEKAPHRPWLTTFMNERAAPWLQDYNYTSSIQTYWFLGRLFGKYKDYYLLDVRHKIKTGDEVEIFSHEIKKGEIEEIIKINKAEKLALDDFGMLIDNEENKRILELALKDKDKRESIGGGAKVLIKIKSEDKIEEDALLRKPKTEEELKAKPLLISVDDEKLRELLKR